MQRSNCSTQTIFTRCALLAVCCPACCVLMLIAGNKLMPHAIQRTQQFNGRRNSFKPALQTSAHPYAADSLRMLGQPFLQCANLRTAAVCINDCTTATECRFVHCRKCWRSARTSRTSREALLNATHARPDDQLRGAPCLKQFTVNELLLARQQRSSARCPHNVRIAVARCGRAPQP